MALNSNYREELIEKLKECAILADKSDKYKVACQNYNNLKKQLNSTLNNIDYAPFKDCESYLEYPDKLDVFEFNVKLLNSFQELKKLKLEIESYGWKNEITHSIAVSSAFGKLREMENEIKAEFGKKLAEQIIYEAKCEVLKFGYQMGLNFYEQDINKYEDSNIYLNSIKVLHKRLNKVEITENDNLAEEIITLINSNGNYLTFKKLAQVTHKGEVYVDLKYLDKTKDEEDYEFYLYKVESKMDVQVFVLEEDDDITDELYEKIERLEIEAITKK